MTDTKKKCEQEVWPLNSFMARRCTRNACVEVDETHYCRQHDPSAAEARKAARHARYAAEAEKRKWGRRRDELASLAYELLSQSAFNYDPIANLRAKIQRHNRSKPLRDKST